MQIHILSPEGEVIGPISIHSPQAMAAHPDTLSRGDGEADTWLPISQRRTAPPPIPTPPEPAPNPLIARIPTGPPQPAPVWRQVIGGNCFFSIPIIICTGIVRNQLAEAVALSILALLIGYAFIADTRPIRW